MNNNNVEFKLLDRKADLEDVVLECSAYLKTKQFMADRIYQQQEEIQVLKQQIFSISSTNSQLGRFIENFEKETYILKEKFRKKEKNFEPAQENLNPNYFSAGKNLKLVSKGHYGNKQNLKKRKKNAKEKNNKFNLSDDDPLIKSEVLQGEFEENKDGSFSEFEQINYNLIDSSQNTEDSNNANENDDDVSNKNYKKANFENGSMAEKDLENINDDKRHKNKFENLKISETNEIQENFFGNYDKTNKNNSSQNKKFYCTNNICNNNFTCNPNRNNNLNLSFYNYNFQINNEKNIDDKIQKLNNEIIEKTIDNNKLRTDKFIIMSELNEILSSLTRIDLDKLNDFYLNNISMNNLSRYLMPTAKGIKFNILSCQNNLAKIIKSDFVKNYEIENLYPKTFIENFNNNDQHYNKNYFSNINNYNQNYHISPIQNPRKLSSDDENNSNFNNNNNDCNSLIDSNKRKIKNVLENNFNLNVNGLYGLFSKHEGEFEALLEKKLMKLNGDDVKNNNINTNNQINNFNNYNNVDNNMNRNHYGIARISNPSHFSTQERYSP
jgi:hypothetical protein